MMNQNAADSELIVTNKNHKKPTKFDLVYFDESPKYCEKDLRLGIKWCLRKPVYACAVLFWPRLSSKGYLVRPKIYIYRSLVRQNNYSRRKYRIFSPFLRFFKCRIFSHKLRFIVISMATLRTPGIDNELQLFFKISKKFNGNSSTAG